MTLRLDKGSCSNPKPINSAQIGIVKASIAERPACMFCTPNRMSPFHPAMLNSASATTFPHSGRGMRIE